MRKVLIIEDDSILAMAYNKKLTKSGFEAINAYDGEEGIKLLKEHHPDLVILDIMMPKKDGYEVLDEMKNDDRLKNTPVIIATNLSSGEELENAIELGVGEYYLKTNVSIDDLVNRIGEMIGDTSSE